MSRSAFVILAFVCLFTYSGLSVAKGAETIANIGLGRPVVQGQLLVTLYAGITADDLKPIFERLGAKFEVVERVESLNSYTLTTDHERLAELRQRLENHPYVANAAFNAISTLSEARFNDPVFQKPPEMSEDKDNWNFYRIKVPEAWEVTTGGAPVAVIDSGVMLDHEDLAGQTPEPYSFATSGPMMQEGMKRILLTGKNFKNSEVRDHGTHVSVTIAGKGGNGVGTVGVSPASTLIPYQAIYYRETDAEQMAGTLRTTDADAAKAISLAIDRGAAAINMSIGGGNHDTIQAWHDAKTDAEREEIGVKLAADASEHLKHYEAFFDRANQSGVIVVVAAGNDHIPAEYGGYSLSKRAISVAATTRENKRAEFSNYGSYTTVSAPGHEIWSGYAEPGKP